MSKDKSQKEEEQMQDSEEQVLEQNEQTEGSANEDASQVARLEAQVAELKDKYTRLFADFDNYKKRAARERIELEKEAGKDIVLGLLPVLDDFERAVKVAENADNVASVKEGMELIHHKLVQNLKQKGVTCMDSQGKPFNPEFHEALTEVPAPNDDLKGKVIDVVEPGYYMNEKIIRYAKVVVGK